MPYLSDLTRLCLKLLFTGQDPSSITPPAENHLLEEVVTIRLQLTDSIPLFGLFLVLYLPPSRPQHTSLSLCLSVSLSVSLPLSLSLSLFLYRSLSPPHLLTRFAIILSLQSVRAELLMPAELIFNQFWEQNILLLSACLLASRSSSPEGQVGAIYIYQAWQHPLFPSLHYHLVH